ncbi:MAG: hypothetical protein U0359_11920 [Byssovorax sp.]
MSLTRPPRGEPPAAPQGSSEPPPGAPPPERAHGGWAGAIGLHPLVAFGMVAVDLMLFSEEAMTAGVALTLTIPIALALTVPCVLLQRYAYGDNWGTALGKGMMVGVLTAIPFPIGSPLTILGAIAGWRNKKALPPAK